MTIKELINEWYYLKQYEKASYKMYISGQMNIKTYIAIRKDAEKVETELFKVLQNDYNIKYPYQEIPLDLDYVLSLVS